MAITLEDIKKLRERTGAGMADCKKALEEANGDMDAAIEILRTKGAATAAKRADKSADEGVIATAVSADNKSAAIVEINCETDFVARNNEFSSFAENLAQAILNSNPANAEELAALEVNGMTVEQGLNELLAKFSERIEVRRFTRIETENGFVTDYVHSGAHLAVLIELAHAGDDSDASKGIGRDVAMQVAAMSPSYARREEVPAEDVEKERKIYREQLAEDNKPAEIVERIVAGRVEKFFEESVLLEQSFVKDSSKSVSDALKAHSPETTVTRFIRFNLGDAVEETAQA